jgi:hypothetical protein
MNLEWVISLLVVVGARTTNRTNSLFSCAEFSKGLFITKNLSKNDQDGERSDLILVYVRLTQGLPPFLCKAYRVCGLYIASAGRLCHTGTRRTECVGCSLVGYLNHTDTRWTECPCLVNVSMEGASHKQQHLMPPCLHPV